ncbi:ATP-grasp domain-containing protein [uncultured Cohaesibacter sp.]|uniref:ATP-grasp domain-containing protein n=1 Tax=uncultured Cohaesibacter sp. TaxID=1002546 RepID=UPI002AA911D3|nr:ATP-grasp domain-containing protein [uncultured Cohaesibacter sp.]
MFETQPHDELIVFVTERKQRESGVPTMASRDLDMTTPRQADAISKILTQVATDVLEINSIEQLSDTLQALDDPLVLPHWNGLGSRNRTGLATSICEAFGKRFIGADTYARLVTADKSLSKVFLKQSGVKFPKSIFVASSDDFQLINFLSMPCIVKPNMEGSSIGIDQNSLVSDRLSAEERCNMLLASFPSGVIVEEYISGSEVSFSALCNQGQLKYWAAAERIVEDDPEYLKNHVYDHELKFTGLRKLALRPFDLPAQEDIQAIKRLVKLLGHIDFIRLDGRVRNGRFHAIEITVDPLLTPRSEFIGGLSLSGRSPEAIFYDIIDISKQAWKCRQTNN